MLLVLVLELGKRLVLVRAQMFVVLMLVLVFGKRLVLIRAQILVVLVQVLVQLDKRQVEVHVLFVLVQVPV
jgi:hypothetical protein